MADINSEAVKAARERIESLVPGAKIKSIVRMNHFNIWPKDCKLIEESLEM